MPDGGGESNYSEELNGAIDLGECLLIIAFGK